MCTYGSNYVTFKTKSSLFFKNFTKIITLKKSNLALRWHKGDIRIIFIAKAFAFARFITFEHYMELYGISTTWSNDTKSTASVKKQSKLNHTRRRKRPDPRPPNGVPLSPNYSAHFIFIYLVFSLHVIWSIHVYVYILFLFVCRFRSIKSNRKTFSNSRDLWSIKGTRHVSWEFLTENHLLTPTSPSWDNGSLWLYRVMVEVLSRGSTSGPVITKLALDWKCGCWLKLCLKPVIFSDLLQERAYRNA